jgi:hypothetical protein
MGGQVIQRNQYSLYRERVLAKTDGANIHKVNGWLGIINDGIENRNYFHRIGNTERATSIQARIDYANYQIKIATGISP